MGEVVAVGAIILGWYLTMTYPKRQDRWVKALVGLIITLGCVLVGAAGYWLGSR